MPYGGNSIIMIKTEFGNIEYTVGTLSHAEFGLDWQKEMGTGAPKFCNLVKFAFLAAFRPVI